MTNNDKQMNSSVREKPSKKCGNACGKIIRSIFWNKIIIQNIEVINIYKHIKPWEKPWEIVLSPLETSLQHCSKYNKTYNLMSFPFSSVTSLP